MKQGAMQSSLCTEDPFMASKTQRPEPLTKDQACRSLCVAWVGTGLMGQDSSVESGRRNEFKELIGVWGALQNRVLSIKTELQHNVE